MKFGILLLLLSHCFIGHAVAADNNDYTLYLVRHAEKQSDGSRDPVLTEAGEYRAEQLAVWLQDKDIKDVWSSDYIRTRDTATPLLSSLGLELNIYDPHDLGVLAGNLKSNQRNAFVIGHSNTTPELARLLCQCDIDDMEESEYDRLIVVSVVDGEPQTKTLHQQPFSVR